jgi:hypothetical protein
VLLLTHCLSMECACARRKKHSSLYTTFKVVQLINQLRKRFRPRVSAAASSGKPRMKQLATDFARHASDGVLRCLAPCNQSNGRDNHYFQYHERYANCESVYDKAAATNALSR